MAQNLPPVAIIKITPSELTLPNTKILIDGSGSSDPNKHGTITNYKFSVNGIVISDSMVKEIEVNVPPVAGTISIELIVTDRGGLTGRATATVLVKPAIAPSKTIFGAAIGADTDTKISIAKQLGLKALRGSTFLNRFNGVEGEIKKYSDNGFKVIQNLNYEDVNNKNPNPFQKDMVNYRKKLSAVFDKYAGLIDVAVIENEPTTEVFHSGDIEDYIALLAVAVEVCHQYGVTVADGAIHVGNVLKVMNNNTSGNGLKVKKLIDAYKYIPLDYVNIHDHGTGTSYPSSSLVQVADYIRQVTGKPVMSNEFHTVGTSQSLLADMVNGFKNGGYEYCLIYSSGDAGLLSNGNQLTDLGRAYQQLIK